MKNKNKSTLMAFIFLAFVSMVFADNSDCSICMKMIQNIKDTAMVNVKKMYQDEFQREQASIEALRIFCNQESHLETSERKFCYYIEPLRQTAARALNLGMPTDRVCKKLNKQMPEICRLTTVVKSKGSSVLNVKFSPDSSSNQVESFRNDDDLIEFLSATEPKFFKNLSEKELREIAYDYHRGVIHI